MSHTNSTTNFGLPQFITTDKPAWLTDVNVAYQAIDTAMKNNQTAASNAQADASQALLDAASAGSTASAASSAASGAIASIASAFSDSSTYVIGDRVIYNNLLYKCIANVNVPGAWTGSTNWARTTSDADIKNLNAGDIEYSGGASVKDSLDALTAGMANVGDKLIFRQTQLSLPSSFNVAAGGTYDILSQQVLTNLTWNALDGIDDLTGKTLVAAHLVWTNGNACFPVNELVESGNKFSLTVHALTNATITAIRLLTFWK